MRRAEARTAHGEVDEYAGMYVETLNPRWMCHVGL